MRRPADTVIRRLRRALLTWYRKHQRELQWRYTRDPYEILVSEVMLQQTQVARVQEKLPVFLKEFPTLRRLADAPRADVIRSWNGMGYNNRAIRLQDLARRVVKDHNAVLPRDPARLQELPGIGRYTAHALACFAFDRKLPVVDVNVRRVLSRSLGRMTGHDSLRPEEEIWAVAAMILPPHANEWNQALMDLGAVICTARRPACDRCPLSNFCPSVHLQRKPAVLRYPTGKRKEPVYDGIPRRIWRGKIIQILRECEPGETVELRMLARRMRNRIRQSDLQWLTGLLTSLEKDGLVAIQRSGESMYAGLASG